MITKNMQDAANRLPSEIIALNNYLDCALMVLEEEMEEPGLFDWTDLFEIMFYSSYWGMLFEQRGIAREEIKPRLEKIMEVYKEVVVGIEVGSETLKALKM